MAKAIRVTARVRNSVLYEWLRAVAPHCTLVTRAQSPSESQAESTEKSYGTCTCTCACACDTVSLRVTQCLVHTVNTAASLSRIVLVFFAIGGPTPCP